MTRIAALLAVAGDPATGEGDRNLRLLWAGFLLVAVLLVGAMLLALADRWRRRMQSDFATTADALAAFRLSYERGELSEAEFRCIQARLRGAKAPARPAPPPGQTPAPSPDGDTGDHPAAD
jgi:hypothetical protein